MIKPISPKRGKPGKPVLEIVWETMQGREMVWRVSGLSLGDAIELLCRREKVGNILGATEITPNGVKKLL